jgi:hypothetical protein
MGQVLKLTPMVSLESDSPEDDSEDFSDDPLRAISSKGVHAQRYAFNLLLVYSAPRS